MAAFRQAAGGEYWLGATPPQTGCDNPAWPARSRPVLLSPERDRGITAMTAEEADAVRTACAELVRLLSNMSEALANASRATRMCAEAAEAVERDLIAISALVNSDD
jgi:hypothetical protein